MTQTPGAGDHRGHRRALHSSPGGAGAELAAAADASSHVYRPPLQYLAGTCGSAGRHASSLHVQGVQTLN